eukprot:2094169-Ditylum_brightwellii.AAC.1
MVTPLSKDGCSLAGKHMLLCSCRPGYSWAGRSRVCDSSNPGVCQNLVYMVAVNKSATLYKGGEEGAHMLSGV